MKLATYKDGSRDGQLVVVSRDLTTAHYATGIASRLQQALDDWNFISPQLQDLSDTLNHGKARHAFPFDAAQCLAPLPRACQRLVGAAYVSPAELLRTAPGQADAPGAAEPRLRQAHSDELLGPRAPIAVASEDFGADLGPELAVLTGDVPQAATPEQGLDAVRLLLLANDVCLRGLLADPLDDPLAESAPHLWPATAFAPVAVTPDELGEAWQGGRAQLTLQVVLNGRKLGLCDSGADMRWHFGQLIAQAARTRRLRAGSLIGSGPVHSAGSQQGGRREWPRGFARLADKRAVEALQDGAPKTGYLRPGDAVRIEAKGKDGESVFGAIEQELRAFGAAPAPDFRR